MKGCKVMSVFVPMQAQSKTEKIKKLKDFTFQAFVKKASHLAHFDIEIGIYGE